MRCKIEKDNGFYTGNGKFRLGDVSMSRILEHSRNGMFTISAMKGGIPTGKKYNEFTPEEKTRYIENLKRSENLARDLRAADLGFISSVGGYRETEDDGSEVDITEFSFIVPYNRSKMSRKEFVQIGLDLAKKYDQNTIAVAGIPEIANGQVKFLQSDTLLDDIWGTDIKSDFSKAVYPKELNIGERPYYTNPNALGERNFVFDSASKRYFDSIAGVHCVNGQGGWQKANKLNEIVLER